MGFTQSQLSELSDSEWAEEVAILENIRTEERKPLILTQG